MEQVRSLKKATAYLHKKAIKAQNVIAKLKTGTRSVISTAVTFDNLRMDVDTLRSTLVSEESKNQKLRELTRKIDDSAVTFTEFIVAIARDKNTHRKIRKRFEVLIKLLQKLHRRCAAIKLKLGDATAAQTKFTTELLAAMTNGVEKYLQGHSHDYVITIRNYALVQEVVIFTDEIIDLVNLL